MYYGGRRVLPRRTPLSGTSPWRYPRRTDSRAVSGGCSVCRKRHRQYCARRLQAGDRYAAPPRIAAPACIAAPRASPPLAPRRASRLTAPRASPNHAQRRTPRATPPLAQRRPSRLAPRRTPRNAAPCATKYIRQRCGCQQVILCRIRTYFSFVHRRQVASALTRRGASCIHRIFRAVHISSSCTDSLYPPFESSGNVIQINLCV